MRDDTSLRRVAEANGRFFGVAERIANINSQRDLRDAIVADCGCLTPEVDLKWAVNEPSPGVFDFEAATELAAFADRSGMRLRGHTLLWHQSIPRWAEAALSAADWRPVDRYISESIKRFPHADEWDVINEPVETGHRTDGLRESPFLRAFGPGYIGRALESARAMAPQARLVINEYGLEYDTPLHSDRRYHFLQLLTRLRRIEAPLDGVGLQSHLDLGGGPFDEGVFARFLDEIAQLGLSITITELDAKEVAYTDTPGRRDAAVGSAVKSYLDVALAQPAVSGVICWQLSDRHSWLELTPGDWARHEGAWRDGEGPGFNRGAPRDSDMRRKPMHAAILAAFRDAPARP